MSALPSPSDLSDPTTTRARPIGTPSGRASSASTSHLICDAQEGSAGAGDSPHPDQSQRGAQDHPVRVGDFLQVIADQLDDLENTRKANESRVRSLRQMGADDKTVARLAATVDAIAALEHGAELELKRAMRVHPLGPWVKRTIGIGEKQGARLLAAIGDPYWNTLHDRPRTISELWAYCGYHVLHPGQGSFDTQSSSAGVAARRRKGQRSNWSNTAKSRAFLCAEKAVMAGVRKLDGVDDTDGYDLDHRTAITPLGTKYLERRTHTADTHPEWTDGHAHNDALRFVAKAILRDLWLEARTLHQAVA